MDACVVDGDNIGVVERGGSAGFFVEAAQAIRIRSAGRIDKLESNVAAQPFIAGTENLSHTPRADLLENPIVPNNLGSHFSAACDAHSRGGFRIRQWNGPRRVL